ncbi:MAG TPA: thioredoxin family protein [Candidatus Paceibacterota bacterium]
MLKSKPLVIVGAVLLTLVLSYFYFNSEDRATLDNEYEFDGSIESSTDDASAVDGDNLVYSGAIIAGTAENPLLDFKKSDYDLALKNEENILLYFYANWCPICKNETTSGLYPAFNNLEGRDVIGFRINYNDNQVDGDEMDLAKKLGINYQHTKVLLKSGEPILISLEFWDKSRYLTEIDRLINQ